MNIGFDIDGVISKYPRQFKELLDIFANASDYSSINTYVITDQQKQDIWKTLHQNGFMNFYLWSKLSILNKHQYPYAIDEGYYYGGHIRPENVYCCDYEKYGNIAKAVLIKKLNIDIFFGDFNSCLQWDFSLGSQPILLKIMPDESKPYLSDKWKYDKERKDTI